MTVTVKIHDYARPEYEAWMARHSQPPTGSPELARLLRDELFAELVRTEGRPVGVKWVATGADSHYKWRFSADTWVCFVFHDESGRLWRPTRRKVVITSISDSAGG